MSIFHDHALYQQRLAAVETSWIKPALKAGLMPKIHLVEAAHYWKRAATLQAANLKGKRALTGDELMDNVPIYDTVQRRYAGFSNVLEHVYYGAHAPKYHINLAAERTIGKPLRNCSDDSWLYICLVHRVTGSGASFTEDHGWRNSIIPAMVALPRYTQWPIYVGRHPGPAFTSIGNQIPPFNKLKNKDYRTAGQEYLAEVAPILVERMLKWFKASGKPVTIQQAVEHALATHDELKIKRFKFVLTAWVMDIAEYRPHLVEPNSDCFHGKNAITALELMFEKDGKGFYDKATRFLATKTKTYPMDVEDVCCDIVRWVNSYRPKGLPEYKNSSSINYQVQLAAEG